MARDRMSKALHRWLDAHGLFGISVAVFCAVTLLSMLLVMGGYLVAIATR
jgi:uncharacterized iron-regulated membrane protein